MRNTRETPFDSETALRIARLCEPFSAVAYTTTGHAIAVQPPGPCTGAVFAVMPRERPAVFLDRDGHPAAVFGKRWAALAPGMSGIPHRVAFTGIPDADALETVAAMLADGFGREVAVGACSDPRALRAVAPHVRTEGEDAWWSALLHLRDVEGPASLLAMPPWTPRLRRVPIHDDGPGRVLRLMEDYGAPLWAPTPRVGGLAATVVHLRRGTRTLRLPPWTRRTVARSDLIAALRAALPRACTASGVTTIGGHPWTVGLLGGPERGVMIAIPGGGDRGGFRVDIPLPVPEPSGESGVVVAPLSSTNRRVVVPVGMVGAFNAFLMRQLEDRDPAKVLAVAALVAGGPCIEGRSAVFRHDGTADVPIPPCGPDVAWWP